MMAAAAVTSLLLTALTGSVGAVGTTDDHCYVNLGGIPASVTLPYQVTFGFSATGSCKVNDAAFAAVSWDLFRVSGMADTGFWARGNITGTNPITFAAMDNDIYGLPAGTYRWIMVGSSISDRLGRGPVSNNPPMIVKGTTPAPVTKASYPVNRGTKYTGTVRGSRLYNISGQAYLCKSATACNGGGTPIAKATLVLQVYRSGAWAYLTTAKTGATGGSATAKVSTSGKVGSLKLRWVVSAGPGYKASPGSTPFLI